MGKSGLQGFDVTCWIGLLAPGGTTGPIIRQVHLETLKALALPDERASLVDAGMELTGNSPEEFAQIIKTRIPSWAKFIKKSGAKADKQF